MKSKMTTKEKAFIKGWDACANFMKSKVTENKRAYLNFKPSRTTKTKLSKYQKEKKKFERYCEKLMDKGLLHEWYYNGVYHVDFKQGGPYDK